MIWPFRKKPENALALVTSAPAAGGVMRYADSRAAALQRNGVRSLLDKGMTFTGTLESDKGAVLDGTVNGDLIIRDPAAALLLRASSRVNGTVRAGIILIAGTVEGNIEGRFVRLYPGSVVKGRITATRLIIDDGATVETDSVIATAGRSALILEMPARKGEEDSPSSTSSTA